MAETTQAWFDDAVRARLDSYKRSSPTGNDHLESTEDLCARGECVECDASRLYIDWIAAERSSP